MGTSARRVQVPTGGSGEGLRTAAGDGDDWSTGALGAGAPAGAADAVGGAGAAGAGLDAGPPDREATAVSAARGLAGAATPDEGAGVTIGDRDDWQAHGAVNSTT